MNEISMIWKELCDVFVANFLSIFIMYHTGHCSKCVCENMLSSRGLILPRRTRSEEFSERQRDFDKRYRLNGKFVDILS